MVVTHKFNHSMSHASYTCTVVEHGRKTFLVLQDIGNPSRQRTLTNDIEWAVEREQNTLGRQVDGVVYHDSEETWDGWNPKTEDFVLLKWPPPTNHMEAIDQYISLTSRKLQK